MLTINKLILILIFSISLTADSLSTVSALPSAKSIIPSGANLAALKALFSKAPENLEPDMAVVVGAMYQNGMNELKVKKNTKKARLYYKSAAKRNLMIANLMIANLSLEEKDVKSYIKYMEIIIRANDKLSIPAGIQLSAFWTAINNYGKSIEVLRYLADAYDEPKSQFLIGWAIISEEYIPSDLTEKDGQFYLYRACHNPAITKEIQQQCDSFTK